MADEYIDLEVETNPDELVEDAYEYLQANITGWQPSAGNVEVWLLEAIARMVAEARDVASEVPKSIFMYFGEKIVNLPPDAAEYATLEATLTTTDDSGWTFDAGTLFGIRNDDGDLIAFELTEDATVVAGDTTLADVVMTAVEPGTDANGLTGSMELIDAVVGLSTAVADTTSSGGVDAESVDDYIDRLSAELTLLTPRPILPEDFALLASRRVDGIDRATAIDGYNPEHNLLTANQSNLETDLTGWVGAGTNCTATRSTTTAKSGAASLRLDAAGTSDMSTTTDTGASGEPVVAGETYTASAYSKGAAARTVKVGIRWYEAGGAFISEDLGTGIANNTSDWTTRASVTAVAPATAAFASVKVFVDDPGGAGEYHYFDEIALQHGALTAWVVGGTAEEDNERMITVVPIDATGAAVSGGIKSELDALLEEEREVNFVVHVMDPIFNTIDVAVSFTAVEGFTVADVETDVETALNDFLDPANWGLPPEGVGEVKTWINTTTLRYLEVANVINNVDGVDYITALTVDGGTSNITLAGPAPLTTPGTIAATGTAP